MIKKYVALIVNTVVITVFAWLYLESIGFKFNFWISTPCMIVYNWCLIFSLDLDLNPRSKNGKGN